MAKRIILLVSAVFVYPLLGVLMAGTFIWDKLKSKKISSEKTHEISGSVLIKRALEKIRFHFKKMKLKNKYWYSLHARLSGESIGTHDYMKSSISNKPDMEICSPIKARFNDINIDANDFLFSLKFVVVEKIGDGEVKLYSYVRKVVNGEEKNDNFECYRASPAAAKQHLMEKLQVDCPFDKL